MPSYQGQLSEEQIFDLLAYIKSLAIAERPAAPADRPGRSLMTLLDIPAPPAQLIADALATSTHGHTLRSWLLTTDHKRIALLYHDLDHALLRHRRRRGVADPPRTSLARGRSAQGRRSTTACSPLHGVIMVWFFLIPSIPAVLGNFLVPLMIGARDVAFPRLNLAIWYLFIFGGAFTLPP